MPRGRRRCGTVVPTRSRKPRNASRKSTEKARWLPGLGRSSSRSEPVERGPDALTERRQGRRVLDRDVGGLDGVQDAPTDLSLVAGFELFAFLGIVAAAPFLQAFRAHVVRRLDRDEME